MDRYLRHRLIMAAAVVVLLLAACGEDADDEPTGMSSPSPEATESAEPDSSPSPTPDRTEQPDPADDPTNDAVTGGGQASVWFARQSEAGIWLEPETLPLDPGTERVLRAVVEAVVDGQSAHPALTSLVPAGTEVLDVRIEDRVAVIDLSGDIADAGGSSAQESALAQQLAQTATQFETVDALRLLVDGQPIDELWGHLDWSQPLTADPAAVAPIIIEQPTWGAVRPPGPVTASGSSVTFESTVELRLVAPDGTVAEDTFTTAAQPDVGRRGPWSHTFDTEATTPGTWTIEAIEPDASDGEGRPPYTTSVEFTVG
ncbi:MAG: GerMN domain-containing protein [Egibacteraceae bacterium]